MSSAADHTDLSRRDLLKSSAAGLLVYSFHLPVAEASAAPFPGFFLYYPSRSHAAPKLRALVDFLRLKTRASGSPRGGRGT